MDNRTGLTAISVLIALTLITDVSEQSPLVAVLDKLL